MPGIARNVHRSALRARLRLIPCALALAGLPLAALAEDINGNIAAPVDYTNPVTLVGDTAINGSDTASIATFESTVDGSYNLVIGTPGTTTFFGAVGGVTPLTGLQVTSGPVVFTGGMPGVTTLGVQSYAGAASINAPIQFTGSDIHFGSTLTGGAPLALTASGNVTLVGDVGTSTTPVPNFTLNAGSLTVHSSLYLTGNSTLDIAAGGISQSAAFSFAAPTVINAHAGPITLDNAGNVFTAPLSLNNTGSNEVIVANTVQTVLDASNVGSGALTIGGAGIVQSGPFIQKPGAGVATFTDTTAAGTGSGIFLSTSTNDFTGAVNLASGNKCLITDANALTLGTHNCNQLQATSHGPLNLGQGTENFVLEATSNGGDIYQSGPLVVQGPAADLNAGTGAITLTNAGNDFTGMVSATGGSISLLGNNNLTMGSLQNGANGAVTLVAGNMLNLGTNAIDTGSAELRLQSGALLNISTALTGGNVSLSGGGITLTGNVTATALSLDSPGASIDQSGDTLLVGGSTNVDAGIGDVTLNSASNDFVGTVNLIGGSTQIVDANALTLGALATASLTASSTGSLNLGNGSISGNLTAASNGGAISQSGALTVDGTSSIDAGAGTITLINAGNKFTGAVTLSGGNTKITDANALTLGSLATGSLTANSTGSLNLGSGSVSGNLAANSNNGGAISQSGALTVDGTSSIDAGAGTITLINAGNKFTGAVTLSGGNAQITDANALTLGSLATGSLTANSTGSLNLGSGSVSGNLAANSNGGAISQSGVLTVDGTSSIDAGTNLITLANASNDFAGAVTLAGGNTQITDANALTLGTLQTSALTATSTGALILGSGQVSGNLVAESHGGAIGQSGTLAVNGTSSLDAGAGAITLTNAGNQFGNTVMLTGGTIGIAAASFLKLGSISATSLALNVPPGASLSGSVTSATIQLQAGSLEIADTSGTSGTLTLAAGTSVSGTGNAGDVTGDGSVSPGTTGATSGSLAAGTYTQNASSALVIHAGPSSGSSTRLAVSGAANLQGRLDLQFIGGTPASGATYTVLTAGNISGQFGLVTTNLPGVTATAHYTSTAVTVSIETSPVLTLDIDDDTDYAAYGAVNDYVVTLQNTGAADAGGLVLDGTLSPAFDSSSTTWQCSATGGAQCTASGSGPLHDAAITMPAGGTASWHITAPLTLTGNEPDATASVALTGSSTLNADDTDTLVLFRDGFDDAEQAPIAMLGAGDVQAIALPATTPRTIDNVLVAELADGSHVLVQRCNLDATPHLRLLWQNRDLGEIASDWVGVADAAKLSLRRVEAADGSGELQLTGTAHPLAMPLERIAQ